ncbi:hypothetical protein POM88_003330 [Heracleum sosnowskyi]|uniref:Uncharacterized protein n=1 Tax=Heracleum sosnowskyi TaxID=360622 RepID=A0AAD8N6R8_9APIA|nr:hypothetical protein POM88_003330 [Heracleum sosnowskyi]
MALTRILRLSNSPPLHHFRRTFSTAINHTLVVFPTTVNRDSKICSKRSIGSFIRHFSSSPMVSNDMQNSDSEDFICSVKSLRQDVEYLRKEFSLLSEVVSTMQKSMARCTDGEFVADYDIDDCKDYVVDTLLNDNVKTIEKSDLSEAMATHFDTKTMGDSLEETRDSDAEGTDKEKATETISDFSQAMATHFNTKIVISQDNKAAEKMSDFSEEIQKSETGDVSEEIRESGTEDDNEKITAEEISDSSEEIQKSDEKATEWIADFTVDMATQYTEIQETEPEGNNETVPDGKEQNTLLKEIESEISHALDFSRVSSQGINFPEDFPLTLENDVPGLSTITLRGTYKLEDIVVTVRTPSVFTPITTKSYQYFKSSNFIMPLSVQISPATCEGGEDIVFDCSAFSSGIVIENVYGGYSGKLVFSQLNENLQTQFKKYLEMRGITPSTTNNIFGYMLDKVNREKLNSLYKFKEMAEA